MILAGDIGGTKTSLAICSVEVGPRAPLLSKSLPSKRYESLNALVEEFLADVPYPVHLACFGVAGPVLGDTVRTTNLPWTITESSLRERLNLSTVLLMNDLEATAHAIPLLEPSERHLLLDGEPHPRGTIAVIAPGTGLGEAFVVHDDVGYRAYPSEGGHADFAPKNEHEIELLRYLLEQYDHVSYERVCSGQAIPNIYRFFRDRQHWPEQAHIAERLAAADDQTPIIVGAAMQTEGNADPPCALCRRTLDMFISILASEAGNMALNMQATGGVYLGGGIPPRILRMLEKARFAEAFRGKGRAAGMLARVPVYVILNSGAALLGAARRGLAFWTDSCGSGKSES